jgi:hypothetical protein
MQSAQETEPLIEGWDGTTWSAAASSNAPGYLDTLYAVSCGSTVFCMAVGWGQPTDETVTPGWATFTDEWTGSGWTIVSSPDTASADLDELTSVSCVSATFCMAAGSFDSPANGYATDSTYAEEWDGSNWTILPFPTPAVTGYLNVLAMTCTSANFCMADGYYQGASGDVGYIEEWNGSVWSVLQSPSTAELLTGISCVSSTFCMASGSSMEEWDGTNWEVVDSPKINSASGTDIGGISCTSSSFCVTTGTYFAGGVNTPQTLIEEWDGTSWVVMASPDTASTNSDTANAVSCTSATFCMAAGTTGVDYSEGGASSWLTFIEEWSGGPAPTPPYYVALGDSFSSGTGAPPFLDSIGCYRSTQAYPELIAGDPGVPGELDSEACNGATINDFYDSQTTLDGAIVSPQLQDLSGNPTLVTLSVGGDDIGFSTVAETCMDVSPGSLFGPAGPVVAN